MKKEQIKVKCIGIDEEAKGIVNIKGRDIYVPNLLEGETSLIQVSENKNMISAKVIKIEEPSKDRVKPPCPYFGVCGGN